MVTVKGDKYRALVVHTEVKPEGLNLRIEDKANAALWVEVFISGDELTSYTGQMKGAPETKKPEPKPEHAEPPKTEVKPVTPKK